MEMSDIEWSLWITNDVRRFVALHLGVEFTSFEDVAKARTQAESDSIK